jgi:anaerobic selenocysteine-containing dehydrogenase
MSADPGHVRRRGYDSTHPKVREEVPMSVELLPSVCPHDCPSVCALEVERLDGGRLGKVKGSERNPYTAGVVCAKVARYAERFNHPDRLAQPLRRIGPKGSGAFAPVAWDDALD